MNSDARTHILGLALLDRANEHGSGFVVVVFVLFRVEPVIVICVGNVQQLIFHK